MNALWAGLAVFTVLGVGFALLEVIPSIARDRMALRLMQAQDELDHLTTTSPRLATDRDVARLRAMLQSLLIAGEPIGLSLFWLSGRLVKRGLVIASPLQFARADQVQTLHLRAVELEMLREMTRACFLASPTWFVVWPVWVLVYRRKFPSDREFPLHDLGYVIAKDRENPEITPAVPTPTQLEGVVVYGIEHADEVKHPRDLQLMSA